MLEAIATDVADNYSENYQPNLVLDDVVKSLPPTSSVEGLLFWRYADEPTATPQPLGTGAVGQEFATPLDIADGREIEVFLVAKTANGEQSAVNPLNGEVTRFSPNKELGTPDFSQVGASANLQINFTAVGYSVARFRRIQYATNDTFTTGLVEKDEGSLNQVLPPTFNITRASGSGTLDVFVRIKHSTSSLNFTDGNWSPTRQATFADSGGGGGSAPGDPPTNLTHFTSGAMVYFNWIPGTGTNTLYRRFNQGDATVVASDSGNGEDDLSLLGTGLYTYYVENADGATEPREFFYNGLES